MHRFSRECVNVMYIRFCGSFRNCELAHNDAALKVAVGSGMAVEMGKIDCRALLYIFTTVHFQTKSHYFTF